jgi:cytosine/adenosine deaminase-related metal-dependent hydrolase
VSNKILIQGGRIVGGPSGPCDLLIQDDRIAAIAPSIAVDDAEIVDAAGMIVAPGFVDTHRHIWQTGIRGVAADWSLVEYIRFIRLGYAAAYRPEDVWISNYTGSLEALDAGITTVCDFCHIVRTPEHADAGLEGLSAAGIRAQFYYGFYDVPTDPPYFADHAARIAHARHFFDTRLTARTGGSLVSLGAALTEVNLISIEDSGNEIAVARDFDLPITAHTGTLSTPDSVSKLRRAGLLGPRMLHVHCNASSDDELKMIADSGGSLSVTPETELQMGMGIPVTNRALAVGLQPTLGIDIVSDYSGDMFAQMRIALQTARAVDNQKILDAGKMPATIGLKVADAFAFATINGARAIGLEASIGSLAVGKQADLILVRQDGIHHAPRAEDPLASLVLQARPSDIDSVFVAGIARKRAGRLVGIDLQAVRAKAEASAEHLRAGFARAMAEQSGGAATRSAYASELARATGETAR